MTVTASGRLAIVAPRPAFSSRRSGCDSRGFDVDLAPIFAREQDGAWWATGVLGHVREARRRFGTAGRRCRLASGYLTRAARWSGRSVMSASTPQPSSRRASGSVSTVQTWTAGRAMGSRDERAARRPRAAGRVRAPDSRRTRRRAPASGTRIDTAPSAPLRAPRWSRSPARAAGRRSDAQAERPETHAVDGVGAPDDVDDGAAPVRGVHLHLDDDADVAIAREHRRPASAPRSPAPRNGQAVARA